MPAMLTVIAAPGLNVPREDKPTKYIDDAQAVSVPASAYYRRRLACGDLLPAAGADASTAAGAATAAEEA